MFLSSLERVLGDLKKEEFHLPQVGSGSSPFFFLCLNQDSCLRVRNTRTFAFLNSRGKKRPKKASSNKDQVTSGAPSTRFFFH
ncbi:hypothetical protein H5410_022209 [Solanum commersonii]|uniref:Uncharacterized protein n=1 Tax=Solanum commersonii TaxID=4109 RepID=A0A9J5ZGI2_SOLCO|nr:hypothetical protein H5410_022209 [Solanum commersonii]